MRIMWLCAFQLKVIAKQNENKPIVTGGWVQSMIEQLVLLPEIEEINIVTVTDEKKRFSRKNGKIIYTALPSNNGIFKYDNKLYKQIEKELEFYKPDIIDVQGIEFYLIKSLLKVKTKIPILATIQGLTSEIYRHYFAGISYSEIIFNRTIRNMLLFDGIIERKYKYQKRGRCEIESLKQLKYVTGRTNWDYVNTIKHNSKLEYFKCNRNLRKEFYTKKWNIESIEKFSVFSTQAHYPLKGLHLLLEAIKILKKTFPQLKLYIAGKNLIDRNTIKNRLAATDYTSYIRKLIKEYDIKDNIIFTGYLEPHQVINKLLSTHVFVLPSILENSSNALGEAQILGTPSVAALVGGNADYVTNGQTGLLYNTYEPTMLADKIAKILTNDSLAVSLSENARNEALKRHDRKKNAQDLKDAYLSILNEESKVNI